jgi:hypothetical protein
LRAFDADPVAVVAIELVGDFRERRLAEHQSPFAPRDGIRHHGVLALARRAVDHVGGFARVQSDRFFRQRPIHV